MPHGSREGDRKHQQLRLGALAALGLGLLLTSLIFTRREHHPIPAATPTAPPTLSPHASTTLPPTSTTAPTPHPSPTASAIATVPAGPHVVITARDPIAEYVEIQNLGDAVVSLDGWRLVSERGDQGCWLGGPLYPGERLRIWADGGYEVGLHCRFGRSIWSNTEPDAAVLYDAEGRVVSRLE